MDNERARQIAEGRRRTREDERITPTEVTIVPAPGFEAGHPITRAVALIVSAIAHAPVTITEQRRPGRLKVEIASAPEDVGRLLGSEGSVLWTLKRAAYYMSRREHLEPFVRLLGTRGEARGRAQDGDGEGDDW